MRPALAHHDEIVRDAIAGHDGFVVKTTGNGFHAVFGTAHDAVDAAVAAHGSSQLAKSSVCTIGAPRNVARRSARVVLPEPPWPSIAMTRTAIESGWQCSSISARSAWKPIRTGATAMQTESESFGDGLGYACARTS